MPGDCGGTSGTIRCPRSPRPGCAALRLVLIAPTTPLLRRAADNPDGLDPALIEANYAAIAADVLVCGASLAVYRGAGHGLYASDHEALNADLLAFINSHDPQPGLPHHARPGR